MKVIIIEDEILAAAKLSKMLALYSKDLNILHIFDSIESSVRYLSAPHTTDLIFMDIQLADGLSFDIFEKTIVNTPVIFTTAFDQYAIKAFKVNSIDYLLKPIDEQELFNAIQKYEHRNKDSTGNVSDNIMKLLQEMNASKYKERLLIKRGQQLNYINISAIAYSYADGKLCYAVDTKNIKHLLETTLSQLEKELPPNAFFRINRHMLINITSISKVHTWLGGRLKIELSLPVNNIDTVVSRERVTDFKEWLGN